MTAIPSTGPGRGYTISGGGSGSYTVTLSKQWVMARVSMDSNNAYEVIVKSAGQLVAHFGRQAVPGPQYYTFTSWDNYPFHGPCYTLGWNHPGGEVSIEVIEKPGFVPVRYGVAYATLADTGNIRQPPNNGPVDLTKDWEYGNLLGGLVLFYDPNHPWHWYARTLTGGIPTSPPYPYPDLPPTVDWIPDMVSDTGMVEMSHWAPPGQPPPPDNPFGVVLQRNFSRWVWDIQIPKTNGGQSAAFWDVWSVSYEGTPAWWGEEIQKEGFDPAYAHGPELDYSTVNPAGDPAHDITTQWPEYADMLLARNAMPLDAFPVKQQTGAIDGDNPIYVQPYGNWDYLGGEIRYYIHLEALSQYSQTYEGFKFMPGKLYLKTPGGWRIADEWTRESDYWGMPGGDPYPESQAFYVKAPDGNMSLLLIDWEDWGWAPSNDLQAVGWIGAAGEYDLAKFWLKTPTGWNQVAFAMDAIGMPTSEWMFGFNPTSPYVTYPSWSDQNPTTEWSGGGTFTGDPGYTAQPTPTTSSGTPGSGFTG